MPRDGRKQLGAVAEGLAAEYLLERGYEVLARNWRTRLGEIDLVVQQEDVLVIVEVRARRGERFGTPEESINARKRRQLERLATAYVQDKRWQGAWRIDVVTLRFAAADEPIIQHYPSAFGP